MAFLIWRRTKSLAILTGLAMMYYWSLFGAWSIVSDRLAGVGGKSYGYLEEKLFPVNLDGSYFSALILYVGFILVIEVCLLMRVRGRTSSGIHLKSPIRVNHVVLLGFGVVCGVVSYWLVRESLETAEGLNLSGYAVTRGMLGEAVPFFTIHQLLNRGAFLSAAIGLAVAVSGRHPRVFVGQRNRIAMVGYTVLIGGLIWFALMLGNKNELLFAGVVGMLLYEANAQKKRLVGVLMAALVGVAILRVIDTVRGLPLSAVAGALVDVEPSQWFDLAQLLFSSNEAYAAHFSLYGALSLKVPLTYGQSLISGMASIVPRAVWPDRPPDIYYYYAEQVGAAEGQGYTIHHAAGWYLNFGILGVAIGALVWGYVWAACISAPEKWSEQDSQFAGICRLIAPTMFVASIPMLMRGGVEGYTGLLVEGLLIPTMILVCGSCRWGWPAGSATSRA
ncbi:MAG: hypothetical protein U0231_10265 [Nitrospiraceae bacterium]